MLPELGHLCVIIAAALNLIQVPIVRSRLQHINIMRPIAMGQTAFICMAFIFLSIAFLQDDFSLNYVALHSNSTLPFYYKFTAIWGAHEGSLLLWILELALWNLCLGRMSRKWDRVCANYAILVQALINIAFISILLFSSNPFMRNFYNIPIDGNDLNPLLQDIGMILHPPILYMGYVGCSVPFSIAMAALIVGRANKELCTMLRPIVLAIWMFLTLGIAMGSFWAYYELGWGGWWFWDPVENASFMPWLTTTALLHCLSGTRKHDQLLEVGILLTIVTFALSLFGTFLVRAGVIISVHSFAKDPQRGLFILLFLAVILSFAFALYVWRFRQWRANDGAGILDKEQKYLFANVLLLLSATAAILIGTLFPVIYEAIYKEALSVGFPYFNAVFVPQMLILISVMLMAFNGISKRLFIVITCALVFSMLILWTVFHEIEIGACVGLAMAFAIVSSAISKRSLAMSCAHVGLAITIIGISIVTHYEIERDLRLQVGDTLSIAGFDVTFASLINVDGTNYISQKGEFNIYKHKRQIGAIYPEKRNYLVSETAMSETAIHSWFLQDIYIALGQQIDANVWSVRIYYKPMVRAIWIGAIFMAIGALLGIKRLKFARPYTKQVNI